MTKRPKPKNRTNKLKDSGSSIPINHLVNDADKVVYFLIESGMAYLAIGNWMKRFPDDYKGVVVKTKETFGKLRKEIQKN